MHQETMKNTNRSYDLLWLAIALFPLIALSYMLATPAQDFWWYMRLGRDILTLGEIPAVDMMGYSRAGLPIFYPAWLSAVVFYLLHEAGGISLVYVLRGLLIGLSYGIVWYMVRNNSGPRLATILVILVGISTSNNWVIRPQLFAYPLFLFCVYALYQWHSGNQRHLYILPVSVFLWANFHGSFILPFILAGAALVFGSGDRKSLLITMVIMVLSSFVNPYGAEMWQHMVFMLQTPSDYLYSAEWHAPTNEGWQLNIFFGWVLLFVPLVAFSKRKLSLLEWVWFLGFGWLAFSRIRHVIWFMLLLAIFSAKLTAEWSDALIDKPVKKVNPWMNITIAACLFMLTLVFLPGLRTSWWVDSPSIYELSTTPVEAVDFLKEHEELPGPLWNNYAFGSYLEFVLPSRLTWIDTRMYSFPPEQWQEYVQVSEAKNWQGIFDREKVNLLLLSTIAEPRLVEAVSSSDAWCLEYKDKYAVIFSRCEPLP